MTRGQQVKVFKNGQYQAVRILRAFQLSGEDAVMRREGDRPIIEPAQPESRLDVLATLGPVEDEFPPILELSIDLD